MPGCGRLPPTARSHHLTPQSAGRYALSLGLSQNFRDDNEMPAQGMVIYGALYSLCGTRQDEAHNEPPTMQMLPRNRPTALFPNTRTMAMRQGSTG